MIPVGPRARWLAIAFVATNGALVSCKSRPDPVGKHRGYCSVSYRALTDPSAKAPLGESCTSSFDVFKEGDAYKVDFGDCTIHLEAPAHSDETVWKVGSPAPCITKQGPARIADGKLYLVGDSFNLSFDGSTDDKKLAVSWGFTTDPGLR